MTEVMVPSSQLVHRRLEFDKNGVRLIRFLTCTCEKCMNERKREAEAAELPN